MSRYQSHTTLDFSFVQVLQNFREVLQITRFYLRTNRFLCNQIQNFHHILILATIIKYNGQSFLDTKLRINSRLI